MAYVSKRDWDSNINTFGGAKSVRMYESPFSDNPSANNINGVLSNGVLTQTFGPPKIYIAPSDRNFVYQDRFGRSRMNPRVDNLLSNGYSKRRRDHRKELQKNKVEDAQEVPVDDTVIAAPAEESTAIQEIIEEPVPEASLIESPVETGELANPDQTAAEQVVDSVEVPMTPVEEVIADIPVLAEAGPSLDQVASTVADESPEIAGEGAAYSATPVVEEILAQDVEHVPELDPMAGVVSPEEVVGVEDATELAPIAVTETGDVPVDVPAESFRALRRKEAYRQMPGFVGSNIQVEKFTKGETRNIMIILLAIIAFCMLAVCCGLLVPQIYVKCCGRCCGSPGAQRQIPVTSSTTGTSSLKLSDF